MSKLDDFFSQLNSLQLRTISALVMVAVLLISEMIGGALFTLLVLVAALLMIREWDALNAEESEYWKWAGIAYTAIPCVCLIWLRGITLPENPNAGMVLVLAIFAITAATDIGAYFAGRAIGGPKLAPTISPGKTWAGLAGGMLAAALVSAIFAPIVPYPASAATALVIGLALALVAQIGDLFESWLKRRAGVKDSGALIPGHGGILDRVDGLVFAVPVYTLLVAINA